MRHVDRWKDGVPLWELLWGTVLRNHRTEWGHVSFLFDLVCDLFVLLLLSSWSLCL